MDKTSKSFRKSIDLHDRVRNIVVRADIADIIVEPHDEPRILLYGYVYGGKRPKTLIDMSNGDLNIRISKEKGETRLYSVKMKVVLPPEKVDDSLIIDIDIGDIRIDGLPIRKIDLKTSNGDILLGGISGEEIIAHTMNGDILLRGGEYKSSSLNTVNGDIRIEVLMNRGYDLDASTKNGKIRLGLPVDSSVKIIVSTVKGRVSITNKDRISKMMEREGKYILVVGEGDGNIGLTALNGDVSINLLKKV